MKFETLQFHPDILKGIQDAGFEQCTPIQEQALPESMAGSDVIAQSQTGSGKTAVFLLTIFTRLMLAGPNTTGKPRALVMVPTRELATQVEDDSVKLGKYLPMKSVAIYGGVEYNKQTGALKEGVDIVVATPGRMIDLYKSRQLSLDDIQIFVIDEADRMFDMGFAPDITYIAGKLPKGKPRQTMLFSATIDENVRRLASRYMKPEMAVIEIEPEQVTVDLIDQKIIYVSNEEKLDVMITLLKRAQVERAIIFTNMKRTAEMLGVKLTGNGLPAKVLTGDITQERRSKIIEGMKSGKLRILVATDVAARGLHIEGITHVFNYDLPDDAANYVHRIGRTARAGKTGTAYSLVCEDHVLNLPQIETYIERKLEPEWIEDGELVKDTAPAFIHRRRSSPQQQTKGRGEGSHKDRGRPKEKKEHPRHAKSGPDAQAGDKKRHPRREKRAAPQGGEAGQARKEDAPKEQLKEQPKELKEQPKEHRKHSQPRARGEFSQGRPDSRGRHHKGRPHERRGPGEKPERTGRPERNDEKKHAERSKREHSHAPAPEAVAPAVEEKSAPRPAHRADHVEQAEKKQKTGLLKRVLGFLKKK